MVRILLLGSSGQLGRAIIQANRQLAAPFEISSMSRSHLDLEWTDRIFLILKDVEFDCLVNCTGYNDVDGAENDAYGSFLINSYAVKEMAIACRSRGARLIHFSSDFVFGGNMDQREPLTEFSPPDPISVYGHSKLKGEEFAETECERAFLVRVATLFGVGGMSATKSNFVEAVLKKASAEKEFAVVDDQTMSPASASDVAKATLELIRQGCEPGIFHAVNTGFATRYEFAREAIRQAGHSVNLVRPCSSAEFPSAARRPRFSALSNLKLRSSVADMPTWQDALAVYLRQRVGN